eukprot:m.218089 g.218089  ORF g.218089 m.218089 type:complete len:61 (+) comp39887_c0_seq42:2474-2656(+)
MQYAFGYFSTSLDAPPSLNWTVERLKTFLRDSGVNSFGWKEVMLTKAVQVHRQSALQEAI